MKRFLIVLLVVQVFILQGYTQTWPYVNHTELGPMLGKVDGELKRVNFSVHIFNGIRPHPNHEIGFLVGLDSYSGFSLMPLALGWRGVLAEKQSTPYVGIDLGYGSALLNKRNRENQLESWYQGGLFINPAVGIRKKSRNGRHAYTWSLGFKKQKAAFFEGTRSTALMQENDNPLLPPGFISVREDNYVFNSLTLKWGIVF